MARRHPNAPFVTTTIYSASPEEETFRRVTEILADLGSSTGSVRYAPYDVGFVGDLPTPMDVSGKMESNSDGPTVARRPIEELFQLPKFGPAVCEYTRRWGSVDRFPVAVNFSAEELGMPVDYLDKGQLLLAGKRQKFTRQVLRRMSDIPGGLYGSVDIEQPVPTPHALSSVPLPLELFVSNRLLSVGVQNRLEDLYSSVGGTLTLWDNGSFYTPFPNVRDRNLRRRPDLRDLAKAVTAVVAAAIESSGNP
ncbi:hypothetical protein [Nocardia caishijiensis]|uniref:Uncharacterized protein n=1 Tax=Nocardia caishijiensis TaxID=184756 RepID=A0ABQ6YP87_9NOCA|nr:hypothetical protein [Nocardia caishijiensis]KAF0847583.1 hypothetical protein FNL39_103485 [Nocardia caishijiensis]